MTKKRFDEVEKMSLSDLYNLPAYEQREYDEIRYTKIKNR